MSRNQWHIGAQECHLMLKELHMRLYMVTKWRCVSNKTFLLGFHCMEKGHFMFHFTTFHNVSIYVKWPEWLVMRSVKIFLRAATGNLVHTISFRIYIAVYIRNDHIMECSTGCWPMFYCQRWLFSRVRFVVTRVFWTWIAVDHSMWDGRANQIFRPRCG